MARPKEFDPDQALDRAVDLFWRKGYEATSVQDLVETLGINRSSLYGTFGDKHALYLAAIDRYCQGVVDPAVAELDRASSPLDAIRRQFLAIPARAARRGGRRGCLLCNAAVERAPADADVRAEVLDGLTRLGAAFRRALTRARAAGEVPQSIEPRALADYLLAGYFGLVVLAKAGRPASQLRRTAELVLCCLEPRLRGGRHGFRAGAGGLPADPARRRSRRP